MGLTIHYSFKLNSLGLEVGEEKLTALHQLARDLPFAEVGDMMEFNSEDYQLEDKHHDAREWLKLQACKYVLDEDNSYSMIAPERAIAFNTWPGEGCEPACFGLAVYPSENPGETNFFSWSSFCKTQYASNPEYGGIEHFVKCHLLVIKMLDEAQRLGILEKVADEGGYWESRSLNDLVERVEEYNAVVAAVVGKLGDLLKGHAKMKSYSPISEFPNFEYLEAEGTQQINSNDLSEN